MDLTLVRKRSSEETDCIFGDLYVDGHFECITLERYSKQIPLGTYNVLIDLSPHLQYRCPHLQVPPRDEAAGGDAGIRIHIANYPYQLEGCIACGTTHNQDSVSNSRLAFNGVMAVVKTPLSITIKDEIIPDLPLRF